MGERCFYWIAGDGTRVAEDPDKAKKAEKEQQHISGEYIDE